MNAHRCFGIDLGRTLVWVLLLVVVWPSGPADGIEYRVRWITDNNGRLWDLNNEGFSCGMRGSSGNPIIYNSVLQPGNIVREITANGYAARGIDDNLNVAIGLAADGEADGPLMYLHHYIGNVTYQLTREPPPVLPNHGTGWRVGPRNSVWDVGGCQVGGTKHNSGNKPVPMQWLIEDVVGGDSISTELPTDRNQTGYNSRAFRVNDVGWMVGHNETDSNKPNPSDNRQMAGVWVKAELNTPYDPGPPASGDEQTYGGYSVVNLPKLAGNRSGGYCAFGLQDGTTPTIVGWIENAGGTPKHCAIKWTWAGSYTWNVAAVGTTGTGLLNENSNTAALDVNSSGVIVGIARYGTTGSLRSDWKERMRVPELDATTDYPGVGANVGWVDLGEGAGIQDLNTLLHADDSAWKISGAYAVNDDGVIAARVYQDSNPDAAVGALLYPDGFNIDGYPTSPSFGSDSCVPPPEIEVRGNGVEIPDGDTIPAAGDLTDFGNVELGAQVSHEFVINNTDAGTLTLDGSPRVLVTKVLGPSANNVFIVTNQPSASVAGLGSTTFNIQYEPDTLGGADIWEVSIDNNDTAAPSEHPYNFYIQGTAIDSSFTATNLTAKFDNEGDADVVLQFRGPSAGGDFRVYHGTYLEVVNKSGSFDDDTAADWKFEFTDANLVSGTALVSEPTRKYYRAWQRSGGTDINPSDVYVAHIVPTAAGGWYRLNVPINFSGENKFGSALGDQLKRGLDRPDEDRVYIQDDAGGAFDYYYLDLATEWLDSGNNPASETISPAKGFWLKRSATGVDSNQVYTGKAYVDTLVTLAIAGGRWQLVGWPYAQERAESVSVDSKGWDFSASGATKGTGWYNNTADKLVVIDTDGTAHYLYLHTDGSWRDVVSGSEATTVTLLPGQASYYYAQGGFTWQPKPVP